MAELKKRARTLPSARDWLAADMRKAYEKGASIRAIAESTGRSYGFALRALTEAGVREQCQAAHRLLDEVKSA